MEERVQTILAKDSNGQTIVLNVWRELCSNGSGELQPRSLRITTRDGQTLERREKGHYQLPGTHDPIISDSPDAP